MQRALRLALCLVVSLAAPAWQRGPDAAAQPARKAWKPPPLPDCTCRYGGANMPLGARVCLHTPEGPRMAECVKELNVTSWRPTRDPCPVTLRGGVRLALDQLFCAQPAGRSPDRSPRSSLPGVIRS